MHIVDSIELQVSLLLFVALAGYLLASRIGQPAVVGQILPGILVGPSLLGFTNRESLMIGLGMAPRGEVAMVIALMGLNMGLIEQPFYVVLVLMSVLTTLVVPPLLRGLMVATPAEEFHGE